MKMRTNGFKLACLGLALSLGAATACTTTPKVDDKKPTETKVTVDQAKVEAESLGLQPSAWAAYQNAEKELAKPSPDRAAAAEQLKAALEANPEFAEAHYALGMVYESQGKIDEAKASLERARELDAGAPEYKVAMGRIYAESGEYEKAKVLFAEVVARDATNLPAKNNLAILALKAEDYDTAKQQVIEILIEDDKNIDALTTLGLIYKGEKNLRLAKFVFQKAITIDEEQAKETKREGPSKQLADLYNHVGLVYMQEGNTPAAVVSFKSANKADPGYLESRLNLGAILIEYLDYERANVLFEEATTIAPSHCVANLGYAATLYATSKYEDSAGKYKYYIDQCDAKHLSSYERLAKLYESSLNDPAQAIKYYRQALGLTTEAEKQTQYKAMIQFLESQTKTEQPKDPAPEDPGDGGEDVAPEEGGDDAAPEEGGDDDGAVEDEAPDA
jgi:tetratricopeptide (TPR) repeat protein